MNRVVLVGRLARDPNELRRSSSDTCAISFTIACDRRSKQENSQADFIPCVAFNRTAEFVELYFKKGMQVGIDGRIQTRNYDGKDGKKVYVTEVVCESVTILEPKGTRDSAESSIPQSETADIPANEPERPSDPIGLEIDDLDI